MCDAVAALGKKMSFPRGLDSVLLTPLSSEVKLIEGLERFWLCSGATYHAASEGQKGQT